MTLSFTVPGKAASNNRTIRHFGGRAVKSQAAQSFQQRVFQYAFVAAKQTGWQMPAACVVHIDAYNVRIDLDNLPKSIFDGMSGCVYDDDKRVVRFSVHKHLDALGERVTIAVSACEELARPTKRKTGRAA